MKPSESQTQTEENSSQQASKSPRWVQRLILILIPVALTIGGATVLFKLLPRERKSPSSTTVQQPAPLSVKLADVQASQIKESSEFIASLQSLSSESLQAKTQGKVSQIFVKQGSQVTAQAPLLQIESNNQATQTDNSSAGNSAIQEKQLQLQNARTQLQELEVQHLSKLQNIRLSQEKH